MSVRTGQFLDPTALAGLDDLELIARTVVEGFLSAEEADRVSAIVRKCFHLPVYALLGFLSWWSLRGSRRRDLLALGVVLTIAIADESLQSIQPTRNGSILDVGIDLFGGWLGLLLATRLDRRRPTETSARD